jgi:hypothetical protein
MALPGQAGPDRFLPASRLRESLGDLLGDPAPAAPIGRASVDVVYESALRTALLVIVAR